MSELREFYRREAKKEWRSKKWKKFRDEALVFLAACVLIAAVAWIAGLGR